MTSFWDQLIEEDPWILLFIILGAALSVVWVFQEVAVAVGTRCTDFASKSVDGMIAFGDFVWLLGVGLSALFFAVFYLGRRSRSGLKHGRQKPHRRGFNWLLWLPVIVVVIGLVITASGWAIARQTGTVCTEGLVSRWF